MTEKILTVESDLIQEEVPLTPKERLYKRYDELNLPPMKRIPWEVILEFGEFVASLKENNT
jgi:hypothetical protein